MFKRRYLISAILLFSSLVLDQITKRWGLSLPSLHFNEGFIMGYYSQLPASYRIVALSAFGGFVFFVYVLLLYVVPSRGRYLKYGLSLMVGGIMGNVIDKIVYGRTIDFIPFKVSSFEAYFNLADVSLWIGAGMVSWILIKQDRLVWYPESSRGNYLIWPKEQFKVGLNFSLIVFCCSVVLGLFSFAFFNSMLMSLGHENKIMMTFFLTYSTITLLFCSISFVAGIIISHRSAGPLYAFEQYVDDLIEGQDRKLQFRSNDNYKDLEEVAERLRQHLLKR